MKILALESFPKVLRSELEAKRMPETCKGVRCEFVKPGSKLWCPSLSRVNCFELAAQADVKATRRVGVFQCTDLVTRAIGRASGAVGLSALTEGWARLLAQIHFRMRREETTTLSSM